MTIEELKDLIDSTINENGTKAITGKALNLALNEIANAVAEAATTGGGGDVKKLYVSSDGPLGPEQLASNASLYTEIVTAFTNGELPPQVAVLVAGNGYNMSVTIIHTMYDGTSILLTALLASSPITFELTSDGNCSISGGNGGNGGNGGDGGSGGSGGSGVPS